ncbi:MAG: crossover junction endodeoxyribonuclease RuvC, partial [Limnohabitans sp.]
MNILGIDPGLQTTGFGVVQWANGHLHYVASGTITTTQLPRSDLTARIGVLFEGICEVSKRYQPQTAAIEIVF